MSYYEPSSPGGPWPSNRPSWDTRSTGSDSGRTQNPYHQQQQQQQQQQRPYVPEHDPNSRPSSSHSGTGRSEEISAFGSQIDEVDRAVDNLLKSGKMNMYTPRRESMPGLGSGPGPVNPVSPQPRMGHSMPPRTYSAGSNYEDMMRSQSAANLQNFYANARFAPRPTDAEQAMQAKRRLAAQRERDLRNYHQEQQYNRSMPHHSRSSSTDQVPPASASSPALRDNAYKGPLALLAEMSPYAGNSQGKDRVVSPNGMTEDDRREQIARQHRSLYPDGGAPLSEDGYADDGQQPRVSGPSSGVASNSGSVTGGTRGSSPLAFDAFGYQNGNQELQPEHSSHNGVSPARSRTNSVQAQSTRTSASSPGGSPPRGLGRVSTTPVTSSGVAPIGTRPLTGNSQQVPSQGLQKRSTTPVPSPLGYGFHQQQNDEQQFAKPAQNERSSSAASNHTQGSQDPSSIGWGKVWGGNKMGTVASVWG